MAEESKEKKYITCTKCKCKYINDEEHISRDFGYTRLEERYKTCVKCRDMVKTYNDNNKEKRKEHYKDNKEKYKEYYNNNKEHILQIHKNYRNNNVDKYKDYEKQRNKIKINCPNCNAEIIKKNLMLHQQTQKCISKKEYIEEHISCNICDCQVSKKHLLRHQRSQKCKLIAESKTLSTMD